MKIIFNFEGNEEMMECKKREYLHDIFTRFAKGVNKNIEQLYFLYQGNLMNPESRLESIIQDLEEQNKEEKKEIIITMLVFELEEEEKEILKQSNDIICPLCKEICLMDIKDYKIKFSNCKNGHCFTNILINEFNDFQKINESKILCNYCSLSKNDTTDNIFFKCCDCNTNLCPLCKLKHDKTYSKAHIIIDYDKRNYC